MKSDKIIKNAIAALTDRQQQLINLLTNENVRTDDVIDFLNIYDIDNETAVTSFLINDLLDKFDISDDACAAIPRIRGLLEYFRFQNATAIMRTDTNELITNPDLYLKIRFSEDVRPFVSIDNSIDNATLKKFVGKRYYKRLQRSAKTVQLHSRKYSIPDDSFTTDILYLNLLFFLLNGNKNSILCGIYDVFRYTKSQKCSPGVRYIIYTRMARKRIKKVAIWLLKSKL